MPDDLQTVRVEGVEDGITLVTLDRPDRLNAMSSQLVADLHTALDQVDADRSCRVVILTGAGRGFCAGLDLKDVPGPRSPGLGRVQAGLDVQHHIASLIPRLRGLRVPVIAAVNGAAAGSRWRSAPTSASPPNRRSSTSRSSRSGCPAATSACRGCCHDWWVPAGRTS